MTGDVVVSTVPAAAQTPELLARCARRARWSSRSVYDPWPTPLAASAVGPGARRRGLDLLVHQAVLQVALMTGLPAPLAAMRAAGEAALAARQVGT